MNVGNSRSCKMWIEGDWMFVYMTAPLMSYDIKLNSSLDLHASQSIIGTADLCLTLTMWGTLPRTSQLAMITVKEFILWDVHGMTV